jgi:hypothetical protein
MDRYVETEDLLLKIHLLVSQGNERIVKSGTVLQVNKHKAICFWFLEQFVNVN